MITVAKFEENIPEPELVEGSQYVRYKYRESFEEEEEVIEYLASVSDEVKQSMGHNKDTFIVRCQYAGYSCNTV